MPEISVVMPVYNGEEFLSEAIESILNQSFGDFEFLIVCEYGSNPESLAIVERYAEADKRIRPIFNNSRLGISASLNAGLKEATGKYIARMDGDDISGKRRFEVQKLFLDTYPEIGVLGIAHGVINSPNWKLHCVSDPLLAECQLLFFASPVRHPTIMLRAEAMNNIQYDEALPGVEDYDLYDKLSRVTKISNIIDSELFSYRRTKDAASVVYGERDNEICLKIQQRIFSERLGLQFDAGQMNILHLLSDKAYREVSPQIYVNIILELEELLEQIEEKNHELNTYKQACMTQVLSQRWYREKYKLDIMLKKKIPHDVMEVWRESKYYSPWF